MVKANSTWLALAASLVLCSNSEAQLFRAYLASDGSDANPCTLQAPCRLLPSALVAVANGGEIWMLDSANYNTNTVTINKSVTILAVPGAVGSIVAQNNGPAIDIPAANLTIALRNVVIGPVAGQILGTHGVQMFGASALTIENSLIANLPDRGVYVIGVGKLILTGTTLRNNGGIAVDFGGASATISNAQVLSNGNGVRAVAGSGDTTRVSIGDSVISGGAYGVDALAMCSTSDAVVRVSVTRTTIERTSAAALSSGSLGPCTAEINVGGSLIVDNNNAWQQTTTGSAILTLGNNQMRGNVGSVGTMTPLAPL